MTDDPWGDLRGVWRDDGEHAAMLAQVRRAERARVTSRLSRTIVALTALAGLTGAVMHAANRGELILAVAIGLTIAGTWIALVVADRRRTDLLSEPPLRYLEARLDQMRSELRSIHFVWAVLGLELVFLIPWWLAGIPRHFGPPASLSRLLAVWIPAAVVLGFLLVTVRRWRRLRTERSALQARSRGAEPE